ncbi:MAG: GTP cyclohydrolase IIa [Thaumarchaeota archaeon]|jgi:GTP cyclohydrolase III|nr:GTP cyclohydrolase IIa [Nitrososphaerota archaeon]
MKVTVIELLNYEEWISGLGTDREWKVQTVQHRLYSELQKAVSEHGGFLVPMTFHHMLIIANGINQEAHNKIYDTMKSISPVPFRASSATGKTLVNAEREAFRRLKTLNAWQTSFIEDDGSRLVAAHFDIDSYLRRLESGTIVEAMAQVNELIKSVNMVSKEVEGVSAYLGGDNVVLFAGEDSLEKLENLELESVKIGIGVAVNARESLKLAAEALAFIRKFRGKHVKVIKAP